MEEKLLRIIGKYGINNQLRKFNEEAFELEEAIINAENYNPLEEDTFTKMNCNLKANVEHITEEIADVMVMLEQFKNYYDISSEEITKIFWSKVDRQLGRIEKEVKDE